MGTGSLGTGTRKVGGVTACRWVSGKDALASTSPSVTPEQPTSPHGRPSPSRNKHCPSSLDPHQGERCQGHQQPGLTDSETEQTVTEREAGKEVPEVG